jgi:hypothetical protein
MAMVLAQSSWQMQLTKMQLGCSSMFFKGPRGRAKVMVICAASRHGHSVADVLLCRNWWEACGGKKQKVAKSLFVTEFGLVCLIDGQGSGQTAPSRDLRQAGLQWPSCPACLQALGAHCTGHAGRFGWIQN